METTFKIRTYGRTELAQLYHPGITSQSAWRKLKKWFSINPQLQHLCRQHERSFTPSQVEKIIRVLGEP